MEKLIDILKQFDEKAKDVSDEAVLQKAFEELAPVFLYGGYLQIRNDYKVYIRTVEFYFHSEKKDGIHDPIVYHRNGRDFESVPYFPIMTLHAHTSGFDITFENEAGAYRASALIRAYEVIDQEDFFMKWEKNEKGHSMFLKHSDYKYNTQSTYLYAFLNGFPLTNDNDIRWVDSPRKPSTPTIKSRQNVFRSESEWEYLPIKEERCERKWSFTRNGLEL